MKIEGPLGVWPWPILNTIIAITGSGDEDNSGNSNMTMTEVHRDNDGRITSIEEFRKE